VNFGSACHVRPPHRLTAQNHCDTEQTDRRQKKKASEPAKSSRGRWLSGKLSDATTNPFLEPPEGGAHGLTLLPPHAAPSDLTASEQATTAPCAAAVIAPRATRASNLLVRDSGSRLSTSRFGPPPDPVAPGGRPGQHDGDAVTLQHTRKHVPAGAVVLHPRGDRASVRSHRGLVSSPPASVSPRAGGPGHRF
jgi:hypothetical protein